MMCEICNQNGLKNERGLKIHMGMMHKHHSKPSDERQHHRGARDRREHPGHNDELKSEGRLSCHISRKHPSSTDGKGSQPPTGTDDRRGNGARPKTHTLHHKDQETHYSDKDIDELKSEGRLSCHISRKHPSSTDGKGSQPPTGTDDRRGNGARPKTHTLHHKNQETHYSDKDIVKEVAKEIQRDSLQKGSPKEFLPKDGAGGARPKTSPAKHKGSTLLCPAPDFKKYVEMIEAGIRRSREDSKLRIDRVKTFIRAFMDTLEGRSDIKLMKLFKTGSYYDRTKIDYSDEFDFMFYPNIRMEADFSNCPPGYCKIRKGVTENKDLDPFINRDGFLVPELYKKHMFVIFEKCWTDLSFREGRRTQMKPRKPESPAYTLLFNLGIQDKSAIDIDLVPAIRIDDWPKIARQIQSGKWVEESRAKRAMECFHVVTKKFPGDHPDVSLLWRVSFSHAEKELILHANQSDKGCRKDVFRILKKIKENIKSKNPIEMDKFCSYHLKMFILGFYDKHSDFSKDRKLDLLKKSIKELATCARNGTIQNYFIQGDNVLQSVPEEERSYVVRELEGLLQ